MKPLPVTELAELAHLLECGIAEMPGRAADEDVNRWLELHRRLLAGELVVMDMTELE